MVGIEEGKELKMKNVLSLRNKIISENVNSEIMEMKNYLSSKNLLKQNSNIVTTTFSAEKRNNEMVLDMEILMTISNEDIPKEKYIYKDIFHLKNAIYSKCEGNTESIEIVVNEMFNYIRVNKLQAITGVYTVIGSDKNKKEVELYIGINPSIL